MTANTRATLLERVKNHRDQDAWAQFDAIYRPILVRYARQRGLKAQAADEIAQDVLARFSARSPTFEYRGQPGSFRGYLRRAMINAIIDQTRQRRELADADLVHNAAQDDPSLEREFERIEQQELALYALKQIRGELRRDHTYEVYCRLVIEGWSVERVCQEYGMKRTQVDGIKFRVSRKVREKVAELIGNDVA